MLKSLWKWLTASEPTEERFDAAAATVIGTVGAPDSLSAPIAMTNLELDRRRRDEDLRTRGYTVYPPRRLGRFDPIPREPTRSASSDDGLALGMGPGALLGSMDSPSDSSPDATGSSDTSSNPDTSSSDFGGGGGFDGGGGGADF
jgi:uncharacterized membrane protein YgcG